MGHTDHVGVEGGVEEKVVEDVVTEGLGVEVEVDSEADFLTEGSGCKAMMRSEGPKGHDSLALSLQGSSEEKFELANFVAAIEVGALPIVLEPELTEAKLSTEFVKRSDRAWSGSEADPRQSFFEGVIEPRAGVGLIDHLALSGVSSPPVQRGSWGSS